MLTFAIRAIHESIRERNRKWTWAYFKERRDDRKQYVDLFQKKLLSPLSGEVCGSRSSLLRCVQCLCFKDLTAFEHLERKLPYEDLRFYRSIARSQLRKDQALRKRLVEENAKKQTEQSGSWTAWLWGPSHIEAASTDPAFSSPMTEQQRKELYDVLDYDEKKAIADSVDTPLDAMNTRIVAKLNKGSFSLKTDRGGRLHDVVSVVFEHVQTTFIQRPNNFEATVSLAGFSVFDGISDNTLYPQIVQVKKAWQQSVTSTTVAQTVGEDSIADLQDPFFSLKFEMRPLDERADSALAIRMRHMEIIYHKGYVEAIYKFFKPPASQLESVEALLVCTPSSCSV
jgi:vacuolar protein sorting-associated protein 13A/C